MLIQIMAFIQTHWSYNILDLIEFTKDGPLNIFCILDFVGHIVSAAN